MPLTAKGEEILSAMQKQYGSTKGKSVFYASRNKGTITGVDCLMDAKLDAANCMARGDMTGEEFEELRSALDKWIEEEKKEPEHREDSLPDPKKMSIDKLQELSEKYLKNRANLSREQREHREKVYNELKERYSRDDSVMDKLDAAVEMLTK